MSMKRPFAWNLMVCVAAAGLTACGPSSGGGSGGDETTDTGAEETTVMPVTTEVTATDPSGTDTASFIETDDEGTSGMGGLGEDCTSNRDCESGFCYISPIPMLPNACSECLSDADCMEDGEAGTCQFDFMTGYAVCTDGGLGVQCETDAGCQDPLVCAELFDGMGFFDGTFCSECHTDAECGGQLCTPTYMGLGGYFICVDPGSVPNDEGCPVDDMGQGDGTVCVSGVCSIADLMGFLQIGICGECDDDNPCAMGMCIPAVADMNGLQGSVCG